MKGYGRQSMKKILLKVFTFLICSAVSAGVIVNFPSQENSAKTIPEIQEERKQNEEKIAEYEKQISDLSQNLSDEQEVQQVLSEQIVLIQQNISAPRHLSRHLHTKDRRFTGMKLTILGEKIPM